MIHNFTPNTEGVFLGLSEEEYRKAPGIGQSMLKAFDAEPTPKHYQESLTRPKLVTEAMEFGTILHAAVLTPELQYNTYYLEPETYPSPKEGDKPWDGRATYCKAWKKNHNDRPIIDAEKESRIPKIVETVRSLPIVGPIIRHGQKEVSFFKIDPETGLLLKCRVDAMATSTDGETYIVDLKKVRRGYATATRFAVQCAELGYDIQNAAYIYITGATRFIFVAMEEEAPYDAETWELSRNDVNEGMAKFRRIMNSYSECVKSGVWAGYTRAIKQLYLPAWAKNRERLEPTTIYD